MSSIQTQQSGRFFYKFSIVVEEWIQHWLLRRSGACIGIDSNEC